jgi:hypothetical protein
MNKINAIESGDYLIIKSKKLIKRNLYIEAGNTYCTRIQYNGLICSLGLPTLEEAISDTLKQASFLYPDIEFELNHCYDLCDVLTRFQFLKMDASFMKKMNWKFKDFNDYKEQNNFLTTDEFKVFKEAFNESIVNMKNKINLMENYF